MGKFSRDKGVRNERKIVNLLKAAGIPARRVPLSGGTEYAKGDIEFDPYWRASREWTRDCDPPTGEDVHPNGLHRAEVKSGKSLPTKRIRAWLEGNDILFLDEDREDILVLMTFETLKDLL